MESSRCQEEPIAMKAAPEMCALQNQHVWLQKYIQGSEVSLPDTAQGLWWDPPLGN